jgi:hypothetical protein
VLRSPTAARVFGFDPLDDLDGFRWRDQVVDPSLVPPARRPLIALVDARLDVDHPEFAAGDVTTTGRGRIDEAHGTATASVAVAPQNGIGLTGLWPGGRALNVGLDRRISCADSTRGIVTAIERHAAVISMSYGSDELCQPEYLALEAAVARGIVPVAAAGNELTEGNPFEFPASLPHVVTVGAVDRDLSPAQFSNANAAVDLSAPGVGIPTAVPLALDTRDSRPPHTGSRDGYEIASGTSFSAPMVAAAIAWVRAARPALKADQAAAVVRSSARDVSTRGYDASTGWGVLSVGRALRLRKGRHDPAEPNDEPALVDGTLATAPLLFRGRRTAALRATVDVEEDPADVYRIRVRPHRSAHLGVRAHAGNPDVVVRRTRTSPVGLRSYPRVARARHGGTATERLTVRNRTRRARTYLVAVTPGGGRFYDADYTLTVRG